MAIHILKEEKMPNIILSIPAEKIVKSYFKLCGVVAALSFVNLMLLWGLVGKVFDEEE